MIDLTRTFDNRMPGFQMIPSKSIGKEGWNASELRFYSHEGTHMDAPIHFAVSDQSIKDFPVDRFFVDCHVVKVIILEASQLIDLSTIKPIQNKIEPGQGILFHTGWSHHFGKESYRKDLPRISEDLAEWMVRKKVTFVGVEPPSVADVNNLKEVTKIHQLLMGGDIIIVEGLTNLEMLSEDQVKIIALPLKIDQGDGSPCRVIALEKTSTCYF